MDTKINISLKHFNPSTIGLYNYIVEERSNPNSNITAHIKIPNANELIQTIDSEFKELRDSTKLAGILKILHLTIQYEAKLSSDFFSLVTDLLAKQSSSEDGVIAAKIIYQLLFSLPNDFNVKNFYESGLITEILRNNYVDSVKFQTQLALCASLLIKKFKLHSLLETIWNQILKKKSHFLLVHYIDVLISEYLIYERVEFWQVIETLLSAIGRDDRKLGIFLIRKVLERLSTTLPAVQVDDYFYWSEESSKPILTSWLTYLTILENLEEKQSHLILPSLETLDSVSLGEKTPWIKILLLQMLNHKNSLVLRWSIDYAFGKFTNLILENQILEEFLNATNNTWLYDERSDSSFERANFEFGDQRKFLEAFAKIPWKSVPMDAWLHRMEKIKWNGNDFKLLINVAARIPQLHNRFIRIDCRDMFFFSIFKSNINDMTLHDFVSVLETMFSNTDTICSRLFDILLRKIQTTPCPFISFKMYQIIKNGYVAFTGQQSLLDVFDKVKVESHQWFSLLATFKFKRNNLQEAFIKKHYNIEINSLKEGNKSVEEAISEYVSKLSWDEISKAAVRESTVDLFTYCSEKIDKTKLQFLFDTGGVRTFANIADPSKRNFNLDSDTLDLLVAKLKISIKKRERFMQLLKNVIAACRRDQQELFYKYMHEILDIDVNNSEVASTVFYQFQRCLDCYKEEQGRQLLIRGFLFGEPLTGELRLEYEYIVRMNILSGLYYSSTYLVRKECLKAFYVLTFSETMCLKRDLITLSKNMSIKKTRYFENSRHHLLKLRIAQALARLHTKINKKAPDWDEYYLYAILQENNQKNVTYIYETIVSTTISKSRLMQELDNLKNLSISCQVSMFAISYLFAILRSDTEFVNELITLLLPWTMGANFKTRLYAQITIYKLLEKFKIESFDVLKIAIEKSLKESPSAYERLHTDLPYNLPENFHILDTEPILYVTIIPEDEHPRIKFFFFNTHESLRRARDINLSKREMVNEEENGLSKHVIVDVQRKMNPEIGFNDDELMSDTKVKKSDMVVVASLIDKLPNLGGIARTCEVLGIKNLILDSAKHAQSKEFKNLSMTAENWINISEVKPKDLQEYLIKKKVEGYEIVGAEQTAKSVNFMDFNFPSKCILLLGHEKEGIPADLLALLDYPVEIPQFGMVRSLNVHVTGALFMYEYCKQHLFNPNI